MAVTPKPIRKEIKKHESNVRHRKPNKGQLSHVGVRAAKEVMKKVKKEGMDGTLTNKQSNANQKKGSKIMVMHEMKKKAKKK